MLRCTTLALIGLSSAAVEEPTYYPGNTVAKRNVQPTPGCTVFGQIYAPIGYPVATLQGWDWCQDLCAHRHISIENGSLVPCAHFAFFPDGKCYVSDANSTLVEAPTCNSTHPCEHGFQVVSGPPDCDHKETWVFPDMFEPTTFYPTTTSVETTTVQATPREVGSGEVCNGSLPPQYATVCKEGLVCHIPIPMPGASGTCMTQAHSDLARERANATLDDAPEGTLEGYYYSPLDMAGPGTLEPSWKACMLLCQTTEGCQHFSWYKRTKSCHMEDTDAVLFAAQCEDGSEVCSDSLVITGPRDLSMTELWPKASEAIVPTTTTAEAKAAVEKAVDVATGVAVNTEPIPTDRAVDIGGAAEEEKKSGLGTAAILGIVLGFLALIAILGIFTYLWTSGYFEETCCDEEGESEEGQELEERMLP